MASDINICNMALANIGVEGITSFSELSQQAKMCSNFYAHVRDYLQGSYAWGFNKKQVRLVRDIVSIIPGWPYIYAYPVEALNVQRVYEAELDSGGVWREGMVQWGTEYEQQAHGRRLFDIQMGVTKRICTDCINAWAECRIRVEDVNLFPPAFAETLSWGLATRIALALTKSQDVAGNCNAMYQQALSLALVNDAGESYTFSEQPISWINARS